MLSKKNRADKKVIGEIFKEGRFLNSPNLTFKFILNRDSSIPRLSFITPKNIAKFAVKRNLLRRRGYAALRKHIKQFPVRIKGVFIFKKYQSDVSILEDEIKNILNKIN
ncbi:hypothetical protein A2818_00100 [Candidatus Nomurabacteria bacterium RIFCSPHIGHO2_01_FULL_40_12]|uniref:Uncharacterized protein n=1 Tax=Candidatus Nomurabacteria bacterium RIFCSPHIGHO2_01_FULL_40_12 TaxID=1801737 RepID=A0A1F6V0Q6_9BACT|nr:MAG: hypothetical protein A2818_00100 [Candidatus Nomurabacteria bacterium RIFCSPHIGHO2_01_FULL_40_12]